VRDIGSEKYPYLAKELELLKRMVAADRAVLGICLGAQLLAHAAGAKVTPRQTRRQAQDPPTPMRKSAGVRWTFSFPGGTEPIVMGFDGWGDDVSLARGHV